MTEDRFETDKSPAVAIAHGGSLNQKEVNSEKPDSNVLC
jgi:hypothetical protein